MNILRLLFSRFIFDALLGFITDYVWDYSEGSDWFPCQVWNFMSDFKGSGDNNVKRSGAGLKKALFLNLEQHSKQKELQCY